MIGFNLLSTQYTFFVELNNVVLKNVTNIGAIDLSIFLISPVPQGTVIVNNLTAVDTNIGKRNLFHYSINGFGTFIASDFYFANIVMGVDSSLILTDSIQSLMINNINVSNVTQSDSEGQDSTILNLGNIVISDTGTYSIIGMTVTNSSISMLSLNGITNTQSINSTLLFSDLSYSDSHIDFSQELFTIGSQASDTSINIVVSNVYMTNLTFPLNGNMFTFKHQTANPIHLNNMYFENNFGSSIHLESEGAQNTSSKTKVVMTNITTSNVNSNTRSFII